MVTETWGEVVVFEMVTVSVSVDLLGYPDGFLLNKLS
jgi:hypothetical protein